MIRAIIDGRKTQTRRLIKPQPIQDADGLSWRYGKNHGSISTSPSLDPLYPFQNPYGRPGDQLYVRETWLPAAWNAQTGQIKVMYGDHTKSPWLTPFPDDHTGKKFNKLWLSICEELDKKQIHPNDEGIYDFRGMAKMPLRWRPSIHMPRAASRITLSITDVRVQRLHDITRADAISEGIESFRPVPGDGPPETLYRDYLADQRFKTGQPVRKYPFKSPIDSFNSLWQSIHGLESFDANPWVWAITFQKL